ncbi:MAG: hypothetical protein ABFR95_03050 [Actinomycetota bacterium]
MLRTSTERLAGINGTGGAPAMLLTRSIHTFSMRHPLSIAILDGDGTVLATRRVEPRRVLGFRKPRWIIEMAPGIPLPKQGSRVLASTMPIRCPEH